MSMMTNQQKIKRAEGLLAKLSGIYPKAYITVNIHDSGITAGEFGDDYAMNHHQLGAHPFSTAGIEIGEEQFLKPSMTYYLELDKRKANQ